ncbi:MAG: helix-turn-helix domain-containing protein [Syntrophobacteraceae bacterium]|nr:helix-turn-helix domain-containing protein [Syntrophobacteraceae bacterium]
MSRLEEMERQELSTALERNRWIRRKAARELGLTFRQMNYRVKKFGLENLIKENSPRSRKSSRGTLCGVARRGRGKKIDQARMARPWKNCWKQPNGRE